jgi:hypothetical protein
VAPVRGDHPALIKIRSANSSSAILSGILTPSAPLLLQDGSLPAQPT